MRMNFLGLLKAAKTSHMHYRKRVIRFLFPSEFCSPFGKRNMQPEYLKFFLNRISVVAIFSIVATLVPTNSYAALPTAPTIGSIIPGNGYLQVPFTGASGATSIEYSTDGGISWNTRFTGISAGSQAVWSPLTIHGLTNNQEYSVKLRSRNSSGVAESTAVSATVASQSQIASSQGFLQGQYVEDRCKSQRRFW